jgi:hypothetical protein
VRRLLAISLLALFALPFALPLFGANAAEAELPVCCRRNGKHHCEMMREMAAQQGSSMSTVGERCPYSFAPPAIVVPAVYAPSASASIFAGIVRHPAAAAQTEAQFRISFDRARQKRGPPNISI